MERSDQHGACRGDDCAGDRGMLESMPGLIAVPIGAFADPAFAPWPAYSVYENRKHGWVEIVGEVEHD